MSGDLIVLECCYPAKKLLKDNNLDPSLKINDFLIRNNSQVCQSVIIDCKYWKEVRHNIKLVYKDLGFLNTGKLLNDFIIKNNLGSINYIENNTISLSTTNYTTYNNDNKSINIEEQAIRQNIQEYIDDLVQCYNSNFHKIENIKKQNTDEFIYYDAILKNKFFIKLEQPLNVFLSYYNNFDESKFISLYISLLKIKNIEICNKFNINVSGMSDIADIKKDVVILINSIDTHIELINKFFNVYQIDDNKNILYVRITRLIPDIIIQAYYYFDISINILCRINIIYNIKADKSLESDIIRIFKLIKKLKDNKNDANITISHNLESTYFSKKSRHIADILIDFIDNNKINKLNPETYNLFIQIFVHLLKTVTYLY